MKLRKEKSGYNLWLSATDTSNWAHRIGNNWPCSELSGHRCFVAVDQNGLCDFTLDGRSADVSGDELSACVADHLPDDCKHLWPCWS